MRLMLCTAPTRSSIRSFGQGHPRYSCEERWCAVLPVRGRDVLHHEPLSATRALELSYLYHARREILIPY